MRVVRTAAAALLLSLVLLAGSLPAHASAFPCFVSTTAAVTVQIRERQPIGVGPSCGPGMSCESLSGCVFHVRLDISGYGLLGGAIFGSFPGGVVRCGPFPLHCAVTTPDFTVPFGGGSVRCTSGITAAVHVELICTPTQLS